MMSLFVMFRRKKEVLDANCGKDMCFLCGENENDRFICPSVTNKKPNSTILWRWAKEKKHRHSVKGHRWMESTTAPMYVLLNQWTH